MKKGVNLAASVAATEGENFVQFKKEEFSSNEVSYSKLELTVIGHGPINVSIGGGTAAQQPANFILTTDPTAETPTDQAGAEAPTTETPEEMKQKLKARIEELHTLIHSLPDAKPATALQTPIQRPLNEVDKMVAERAKKDEKKILAETVESQTPETEPWYKKPKWWKIILITLFLLFFAWWIWSDFGYPVPSKKKSEASNELQKSQLPAPINTPTIVSQDTILAHRIVHGGQLHKRDIGIFNVKLLELATAEEIAALLDAIHSPHTLQTEKNEGVTAYRLDAKGYRFSFFFYPGQKGSLLSVHKGVRKTLASFEYEKAD